MKIKMSKHGKGDSRYKTKFLWFPKIFDGVWYWLETVTIRQVYLPGLFTMVWYDFCLSNPKSGLPISIHPIEEKDTRDFYYLNGKKVFYDVDTIEKTVLRFVNKGVYQTKIITTESPSVVIWSKTRECLVGGKGQPEALEIVNDGSGGLKTTYDNNISISLQNRSELTESDVKAINESEGIVVTNATYGKPYFRFGFIPN